MFPSAIRQFSRSQARLSGATPTGRQAAVKWVVYFFGITGFFAALGGVFYYQAQDSTIRKALLKKRAADEAHRKRNTEAVKAAAESE
ncbi:hypothetical protein BN7_218 [Wickerhamomyces ciferrii]|uniref:Uncharacterized protein n=1 Tax=Wickerhamomyces ciferrii (strain ATCC 14091 / BCRC 22168 / CBS 111 / JCM 3599 / NBRC 0793 / NRRL Y-1031 F-60-10) TaxID=1206466 RepID=K0KH23_WICCF|nr:uncharacterized protein BN7_218 [Wickerhamomyces ciferrii]CCH40684.1 hypothetical protein BN7_218 [Wickerhamomyces ciferrii]